MEEVMISTICTTFNHCDYIKRTLDGFISQRTGFTTEYIVHDDCSTDGTTEIIREYEERFPELIKPIYESENLYSKHINIGRLVFEKCKGKYIAFCEGDDYWIDPTKLRRQFEYMEENPDCAMCGHNTIQFNAENNGIGHYSSYYDDKDLNATEVLARRGGTFQTSSFMIKRDVLKEFYNDEAGFFTNVGLTDICLRAFAFTKGKVHFMDRTMSVYRRYLPGSWTYRNNFRDLSKQSIENSWNGNVKIMNFYAEFDKYTENRYHGAIRRYMWMFVDMMVGEKMCRHLDKDFFCELIDKADEMYGYNIKPYLDMIECRYRVLNDDHYWKNIIKDLQGISHYVIYGIGDYGHIAYQKLMKIGIRPDCFVVSSKGRIRKEEEIPVVEYKELDVDRESTLIIMGVNTINEQQIGHIDYPNVLYPFSNIRGNSLSRCYRSI